MSYLKANTSRLEKRANKERDIVKACVSRMQEKIDDTHNKRANFKQDIANDIAEIKRLYASGVGESTLEIMAESVAHKEAQLELFDGLLTIFSSVRNVLLDLQIQVDAIIGLEWYKYVIKTIPERKLPRMISSENHDDLYEVIELVESILKKIEDKITNVVKDKTEHDKIMKRIRETSCEMRKRYDDPSKARSASLAKILGTNTASAPKTMPLPVENKGNKASAVKPNQA